ncbi:MAG: ABC transporter permease [Chloroflexota bacterium]|nr:ABC transporter permease [Chloroflexota bacterium]
MVSYILKRLVLAVPVLLGITVVVFLLVRLIPGDVIDLMLGTEGSLRPEVREQLRQTLGLDRPLHVQYFTWLGDILRGDLGRSLRTGQPIVENLAGKLPITLELAFLSVVMSLVIAIPLGIVSALRRNSFLDFVVRMVGTIGLSLPNFWLATMLILIASIYFRWGPALIYVSPLDDLGTNLKQMLLPSLALALGLMAVVMRMTRSSMLEVLSQDYIQTARAKGLRERLVIYRHALRNALMPVLTVVGIQTGQLLGGAVIVEQIYGLPGLGWFLLNGIYQRDYPVVQAGVLIIAGIFVVTNLVVDLLYAVLDPRIQYA